MKPSRVLLSGLCCLLAACQSSPSPLLRQAGPASFQARSVDIQPFQGVDGEGDTLTQDLFRDFDQGVLKENVNLLTQGFIDLHPSHLQGQFISQPLKAPHGFDNFTPGWNAQGQVKLQARLSQDGQNWGPWLELQQEKTYFAPQAQQWIQYRVHFLAASPQAERPRFDGVTFMFGQGGAEAAATLSRQQIAKPEIVSRAAWGAAKPKGDYTPHRPDGIVIHHTWVPNQSQYQGAASIRGVQRYHMNDKKWSDIGYHFMIGPEGTIYQGRPETVVGAHSSPNTGKIGICLVGDFDPGKDPFTPESREALMKLMTWLTAEYGIQVKEFYGHRDFAPKSCPGEEVYKHLNAFKEEVLQRLKDAGITR